MSKPAHPTKNHLAAIHIAFKALGISKDDACALKQRVTGVASAGDISRTSASLLRRGLYVFGKTAKIPLIEIKRNMGLTSAKAGGATCATCVQAKRIDTNMYWCGRAAFVVGGVQSTCRLHDPMEVQS